MIFTFNFVHFEFFKNVLSMFEERRKEGGGIVDRERRVGEGSEGE